MSDEAASGQVIGTTRYCGYDPDRREVEIGWTFLVRSHWGGPWNAEMKQLMLGHAFRSVSTVIFIVGENNRRSRRAVEKIGGMLRERASRCGADHVTYEIRRPA